MDKKAKKSALAVYAHPDDVEFQCAGTLALLRDRGFKIAIMTMTPGDCGSMELRPEEIARIRRREAADAASLLEADYFCGEQRDICVEHDTNCRRVIAAVIRRVDPAIVFTHCPIDYMHDHINTSKSCMDACFAAGMPNFWTYGDEPPSSGVPHLYYSVPMEAKTLYGDPWEPRFRVDISEKMDVKVEMLSRHKSQRDWLLKHHGIDEYIESMKRWAAEQGKPAGLAQAEGFRQHLGHAFPRDNILAQHLQIHD